MYPNMIIVLISNVEMELILPEMYPIMILFLIVLWEVPRMYAVVV